MDHQLYDNIVLTPVNWHMKCQRQLLQIKWHQFIRNRHLSDNWSSIHFRDQQSLSVTPFLDM